MKAKKAIKRLHRVEALLGTVMDECDAGTPEVHSLLGAARSNVISATEALAEAPTTKPTDEAGQPRASRLSDAARKRVSVEAKERWADVKPEGTSSLAKPSRKQRKRLSVASAS